MKPIPIGVMVNGAHFTIEEVLAWAKSQNLLDEEDVREIAVANWLTRKSTVWANLPDDLGDWYRAEKKLALCAFLNGHLWFDKLEGLVLQWSRIEPFGLLSPKIIKLSKEEGQ